MPVTFSVNVVKPQCFTRVSFEEARPVRGKGVGRQAAAWAAYDLRKTQGKDERNEKVCH